MNSQPDLFFSVTVQNFWNLSGWIIGIILSVASLLFAYYSHRAAERKKKMIDWSEIQKASVDVKNKIVADGGADVFLAIDARSAIFAYKIEEIMPSSVPSLVGFCFAKSHIEKDTMFDGHIRVDGASWSYFIPENLRLYSKSKIVVFDDFAITGRTFARLVKSLLELGFKRENIKTASIACTTTAIQSRENPDYYFLPMEMNEAILPWGKMTP